MCLITSSEADNLVLASLSANFQNKSKNCWFNPFDDLVLLAGLEAITTALSPSTGTDVSSFDLSSSSRALT
jgi:hypothetical protein